MFLEFLNPILGYSESFRSRSWWSGYAVVVLADAFEPRKSKSVYAVAVDSVTSVPRDLGFEFVVAVDSELSRLFVPLGAFVASNGC